MSNSAEQADPDSPLMAPLVRAFQRRYGLSDTALAAHLRIDAQGLARLLSARQPRPERRVLDVLSIATTTGSSAALIWGLIHWLEDEPLMEESRPVRWAG